MEATKLWICYLIRAPMLILKVSKPAPFFLVFFVCVCVCVCVGKGEGEVCRLKWGGGGGGGEF